MYCTVYRESVCGDLENLEDFDPFTVPTIRYGNWLLECTGHTSVDFDDLLRP